MTNTVFTPDREGAACVVCGATRGEHAPDGRCLPPPIIPPRQARPLHVKLFACGCCENGCTCALHADWRCPQWTCDFHEASRVREVPS
jgi:hypothetical protein